MSSRAVTDDLQHHSATHGVKILGQNATRFNASCSTTAHDFLAPSDRLRNDQTFSTVASVNPQFNLGHDIYIPTSTGFYRWHIRELSQDCFLIPTAPSIFSLFRRSVALTANLQKISVRCHRGDTRTHGRN